MVTSEILGVLLPQLNPNPQWVYDFERSLQGPALNMMLRGVLVDTVERERVLHSLRIEDQRLREYFNKLSAAVGFPGTNPNSTQQLKKIFYDYLLLPKQYNNKGGKRSLTLDKNALENIEDTTLISKALIKCIKAIRETGKKRE